MTSRTLTFDLLAHVSHQNPTICKKITIWVQIGGHNRQTVDVEPEKWFPGVNLTFDLMTRASFEKITITKGLPYGFKYEITIGQQWILCLKSGFRLLI